MTEVAKPTVRIVPQGTRFLVVRPDGQPLDLRATEKAARALARRMFPSAVIRKGA